MKEKNKRKINIDELESNYEKSMLHFLSYINDAEMKTKLSDIKSFVDLYLPGIAQKIAMPDLKEFE